MLRVPKLRQPDDVSCVPTCVEAVLRFLGYDCSAREISRWCHATVTGCDVDLAVQGLREAGLDASMDQCSVAGLRELVDSGFPPIIILNEIENWTHAVVVCEVTEAEVVLMDPHIGDYHSLTHEVLYSLWLPGHGDVMQVGKRDP